MILCLCVFCYDGKVGTGLDRWTNMEFGQFYNTGQLDYTVSQKPDTPIMSYNSSKNRTVSTIFDTSNCPSTLDTLP